MFVVILYLMTLMVLCTGAKDEELSQLKEQMQLQMEQLLTHQVQTLTQQVQPLTQQVQVQAIKIEQQSKWILQLEDELRQTKNGTLMLESSEFEFITVIIGS